MRIINKRGQTGAIESIISNACDAIGNRYSSQTGATIESIVSNAGDAIGNRYRSQTAAVIESRTGNFGNGIGQVNRREVFASGKRAITDSGVLASRVFLNRFYLIFVLRPRGFSE